ncbi:hypothetical protein BDY19DRAFT_420721 [Irpex rosettiformis]|uniref:Uncharacterized protein n=1 Tax=Irpex rosettiformis TaxID=378272 RepID=A0ACB8UGB3_9APHY|nr:hypothetical protein BDY19DRAFT_420721 [Irpex rosettiformis]
MLAVTKRNFQPLARSFMHSWSTLLSLPLVLTQDETLQSLLYGFRLGVLFDTRTLRTSLALRAVPSSAHVHIWPARSQGLWPPLPLPIHCALHTDRVDDRNFCLNTQWTVAFVFRTNSREKLTH